MYRNAPSQRHHISVNGGTDKIRYEVSAAETAFLRAEGILRGRNVGNKSAKEYYETGINLSMEQYTVAADDYLAIDQALSEHPVHPTFPLKQTSKFKTYSFTTT